MDSIVSGGASNLFGGSEIDTTRRRFMQMGAAAATALNALGSTRSAFAADGGADTIFLNGTIIPVIGAAPVQALAVAQGKVIAAGRKSSIAGLKTKNTQTVDLNGRTLLPGLIDPHNHTVGAAIFLEIFENVGYTINPTRRKLIDAMRAAAARTPPGQWLSFSNFDNLLQGGDLTRDELDSVSTQHPIIVFYINMHDACVNSMALQLAKVPDNIGALPGGGRFDRDENGKLNGRLHEDSALMMFAPLALPKLTPQLANKAISDYARSVAAVGNTMIHDPGSTKADWIAPLSKLSTSLACRTSTSVLFEEMKGLEPYKNLGLGATARGLEGSTFYLYGVKIVGDGSNQTETGAQTQPYLNSQNKGTPNYSAVQLKEMTAAIKAFGMNSLIHCNGDYTIDIALDAMEAAYGGSTAYGINRIEHATMLRQDQIERMKKLNVQPTFLMNHVRLYGAAYRDQIFGPQRTANTDPAGSCVKAGLPFTLHTDSPCSPIGPLSLVETAVTRRCIIDQSIIGKEQAVTIDQALRAVTIDAALQIGQGDRLGSLEKGKEADITILEDSPYKVDPDTIGKIKVSETWVAGQKKFG